MDRINRNGRNHLHSHHNGTALHSLRKVSEEQAKARVHDKRLIIKLTNVDISSPDVLNNKHRFCLYQTKNVLL